MGLFDTQRMTFLIVRPWALKAVIAIPDSRGKCGAILTLDALNPWPPLMVVGLLHLGDVCMTGVMISLSQIERSFQALKSSGRTSTFQKPLCGTHCGCVLIGLQSPVKGL